MHQSFVTTTRGLDRTSPPMRLYEKAKRLGIWNPDDLDFSQDKADWQRLTPDEQDLVLRLTSLFQSGEEAVTLDLLPLIMAIAREGRLEEEMYLTTFLWEEAKHTDFFNRFLVEVAGVQGNLNHYHTPSYRAIFYEALPASLQALRDDPSPAAQVRASVTYNMVVEGMLAETGYHAYFTVMAKRDLFPGQRQGIYYLKQDESRHIAYGIYLLSRLIAADDSLWQVVEDTFNELVMPAITIISEGLSAYDDPKPFDITEAEFIGYAMSQVEKRIARLERARGASLNDIYRVTQDAIDHDDA
ncbi:MAG: R2-like ligand-binding oxidase [Ardenticatenales bacterium]|nr:R2-like ligand-binding oxidase [Ardenticatenales bacterium]